MPLRVLVNVMLDSTIMVKLVRPSIVNHVMLPARHALVLVTRPALLVWLELISILLLNHALVKMVLGFKARIHSIVPPVTDHARPAMAIPRKILSPAILVMNSLTALALNAMPNVRPALMLEAIALLAMPQLTSSTFQQVEITKLARPVSAKMASSLRAMLSHLHAPNATPLARLAMVMDHITVSSVLLLTQLFSPSQMVLRSADAHLVTLPNPPAHLSVSPILATSHALLAMVQEIRTVPPVQRDPVSLQDHVMHSIALLDAKTVLDQVLMSVLHAMLTSI